ncbi:hypothetical protein B566_EDAN003800 [Ephemera danica]|nr:hypothetical protein B566_EDAN003800 [Ephemera danica]
MPLKLYYISDSPPATAVKMTLTALNVPHTIVDVDYMKGEHTTEAYAKLNPQKEVPVLDDDGFYLSESVAMMQYICDKYAKDDTFYPKDPQRRAVVNHRLIFNISTYYRYIIEYTFGPVFAGYERTDEHKKKAEKGISVLETYLSRQGTKFAAGDTVTIADFGLVVATMCLEAIGFDLSPYPTIQKWYADFKVTKPDLWAVAEPAMKELHGFYLNPPDLSKK